MPLLMFRLLNLTDFSEVFFNTRDKKRNIVISMNDQMLIFEKQDKFEDADTPRYS